MMTKAKGIVTEFELALRKRGSSIGEDGEPSYPFMFGYLVGFLQEVAENHPKVSKRIQSRTQTILDSMENTK
jgi:hypothetical protein